MKSIVPPVKSAVPSALTVALSIYKLSFISIVPVTVSELLLTVKLAPELIVSPPKVTSDVIIGSFPDPELTSVIVIFSLVPGTVPRLQLDAVVQAALVVPVQLLGLYS